MDAYGAKSDGGVTPDGQLVVRRRIDHRPVVLSIFHQVAGPPRPGRLLHREGRGWLTYFTALYPSAVTLIGRRMDRHLMRWARRKYKRLERSEKRTRAWLRGVRQRSPDLFAHWALRYTT